MCETKDIEWQGTIERKASNNPEANTHQHLRVPINKGADSSNLWGFTAITSTGKFFLRSREQHDQVNQQDCGILVSVVDILGVVLIRLLTKNHIHRCLTLVLQVRDVKRKPDLLGKLEGI